MPGSANDLNRVRSGLQLTSPGTVLVKITLPEQPRRYSQHSPTSMIHKRKQPHHTLALPHRTLRRTPGVSHGSASSRACGRHDSSAAALLEAARPASRPPACSAASAATAPRQPPVGQGLRELLQTGGPAPARSGTARRPVGGWVVSLSGAARLDAAPGADGGGGRRSVMSS